MDKKQYFMSINFYEPFLAAVGIRSGFSAQPDQTAKRDAQRNLKTTLAAVVVGGYSALSFAGGGDTNSGKKVGASCATASDAAQVKPKKKINFFMLF